MSASSMPASATEKRKRPRSSSSSTNSSMYKRGASEDASLVSSSMSTPPTVAPSSQDIESYMLEQGSQELSLDGHAINTSAASGSASVPPLAAQHAKITELKSKPLVVGETWYIVSKAWYRVWEDACLGRESKNRAPGQPIGAVNNATITSVKGQLIADICDGVNVEFVPEEAWKLLVDWYGPVEFPHARQVISSGPTEAHNTIELYPWVLRAQVSGTERDYTISRRATLKALRDMLTAGLNPPLNPRIYCLLPDSDAADAVISPLTSTVEIVGDHPTDEDLAKKVEDVLSDGDRLIVDLVGGMPSRPKDKAETPIFGANNDFFNTIQAKSATTTSTAAAIYKPPAKKSTPPVVYRRTRGTVGLNNLGNTCFMNSALQCLAHIPELTEYFLTGAFASELNPDNPLSTGGALAMAYGQLLRGLFSETANSTTIAPREFKQRIAHHAPAFSGYAQHDTQELLAFLLDGLHEDLNRVLKKPYVEKPDWEGGGVVDVVKLANNTWEGYMKRNDSVIVDMFQGQYKSTLVCPVCSKVSITFDPFMYLTLPLPIHKTWKHEIFYIPWDTNKPHTKTEVLIPVGSSIKYLKQLVAPWFDAKAENLMVCDFFQHRLFRYYLDRDPVTDIQDNDTTVIYELPTSVNAHAEFNAEAEAPFIIPFFNVSAQEPGTSTRYPYSSSNQSFGIPTLLVLDNVDGSAPSSDDIYAAIVERTTRWTSRSRDMYTWVARDSPASLNGNQPSEAEDPATPMDTTADDPASPAPEDATMTASDSIESIMVTGPKPDLFRMEIWESSEQKMQAGHQLESSHRTRKVKWGSRVVSSSDGDEKERTRLNRSDAIIIEWDPQLSLYFFGEGTKGEEARWDNWLPFVNPTVAAENTRLAEKAKRNITLDDCLDEFVKEEQLGEEDLWYCPRCKEHRQATKKFEIWKVPDILVVHLKRFSNSRSLRDKIDELVEFPIQDLNLEPRVGERIAAEQLLQEGEDLGAVGLQDTLTKSLSYDLFAVDEHIGGLGGGHYRAYALNEDDSKWYHFDDSHVSQARPTDAVNSNAYLLFYRRRSEGYLGGDVTESKTKTARENPVSDADYGKLGGASREPIASSSTSHTTFASAFQSIESSRFIGPVAPISDDPPAFDDISNDEVVSIHVGGRYSNGGLVSPASSAGVAHHGSDEDQSLPFNVSSDELDDSDDDSRTNRPRPNPVEGPEAFANAWPSQKRAKPDLVLPAVSDIEAEDEPVVDIRIGDDEDEPSSSYIR